MNDAKETQKSTFPRVTDFLRGSFKSGELYDEEMWLKSILTNSKTKDVYQPQVLQGMWQAYGQMRSARTRGRFAVLATGILGAGLFAYRLFLDEKKQEVEANKRQLASLKSEIEEKERDIVKRQERMRVDEQSHTELLNSYEMLDSELKVSDSYVTELCQGNKDCFAKYLQMKSAAVESVRSQILLEQTNNTRLSKT